MKHVIIFANGTLTNADDIQRRLDGLEYSSVIAADGGSRFAQALGLQLDVIIGDHDSLDELSPDVRQRVLEQSAELINYPQAKDETDLELALLHAIKHGAEHIVIIGAIGGRVDMTLSNLLLLTHEALVNRTVELWEGQQTIRLLRPPGDEIHGNPGDTLSLIPIGGPAEGIKTHNLEYPLNDETLYTGPARGVSNVLLTRQAKVEFKTGMLLAIHTPGRA